MATRGSEEEATRVAIRAGASSGRGSTPEAVLAAPRETAWVAVEGAGAAGVDAAGPGAVVGAMGSDGAETSRRDAASTAGAALADVASGETAVTGAADCASRTARKPPTPAVRRQPMQSAANTSLFMPMM